MGHVCYPKVYLALDVETAGWAPGKYGLLSLGACVVAKRSLTLKQMLEMNLAFYAELAPDTIEYYVEAMRIGCLHLECLDEKRAEDSRYDATSHAFSPEMVLRYMQEECEPSRCAILRFNAWINEQRWRFTEVVQPDIMPIVDTTFFDSGHIQTILGKYVCSSPLGWSGHNLKDLYRGYRRDPNVSLKELGVPPPEKPHHALHDAYELAEQARILLFEKMQWNEKKEIG